jgi:hypothetical protein
MKAEPVALILALAFVGCARDGRADSTPAAAPSPSPPSAHPTVAASAPATPAAGAARNLLMGTGEPRKPEPFTLEQRLLDAASRNDRKTIERALELGAKLHAKDDIGRNSLFRAVMDAHDLELVRWLHAKGVALDEPDTGGRTALSFAAANGRLDLVRYLAEQGARIDSLDIQHRTPLFHAAFGDHREVIAFLLDRGADINARDQFGDTALMVACAKGYGKTAALLLQRGADASLKDQEGRTARERAAPGVDACREPPAR